MTQAQRALLLQALVAHDQANTLVDDPLALDMRAMAMYEAYELAGGAPLKTWADVRRALDAA
jgi:hypothetical protein